MDSWLAPRSCQLKFFQLFNLLLKFFENGNHNYLIIREKLFLQRINGNFPTKEPRPEIIILPLSYKYSINLAISNEDNIQICRLSKNQQKI
jgi:hypothetical protein